MDIKRCFSRLTSHDISIDIRHDDDQNLNVKRQLFCSGSWTKDIPPCPWYSYQHGNSERGAHLSSLTGNSTLLRHYSLDQQQSQT